jgi:hypothetical protein
MRQEDRCGDAVQGQAGDARGGAPQVRNAWRIWLVDWMRKDSYNLYYIYIFLPVQIPIICIVLERTEI